MSTFHSVPGVPLVKMERLDSMSNDLRNEKRHVKRRKYLAFYTSFFKFLMCSIIFLSLTAPCLIYN